MAKVSQSLSALRQNVQASESRYLSQHPRTARFLRYWRNPKHIRGAVWSVARFILLLGLSYIVLSPILFMISMSFRMPWDNMDPSVVWVPRSFTVQVINITAQAMHYGSAFLETLKTGVFTGCLQVVSTCVIGYGFARFKFPGRGLIFTLVLFTLIVPMQTIMSGYYMLMYSFKPFGIGPGIKLLGTYWAFWLPALCGFGLRSAIFIYFYRQFFRGQPRELEEAATVDGCGYFSTFVRIMLPGATSIIVTVFLFALVWQWNDNYMASFLQVEGKMTLALTLTS
nr:carbohydrate ABC transporter permease [bacterium]